MRKATLTPEEINCLLPETVVSEGTAAGEDGSPRDLAVLALELSRLLASSLSDSLRTTVSVAVARAVPSCFGEFLLGCDQPTFFALMGDTSGAGWLAFEGKLSILIPVLHHMLGGSEEVDSCQPRPLTPIEQRLAARFAKSVYQQLRAAGGESLPADIEVMPLTGGLRVSGLPGNRERLATLEFLTTINRASGLVRLGIPWKVLTTILSSRQEVARP
jgi:flagellar motor switch protein FliM